jgi:hypothetical protein
VRPKVTVAITIPGPLKLPTQGKLYRVIGQTMNRLRLAMSEIRVVRAESGTEHIANDAAFTRMQLAYTHAAQAIGLVRKQLELTEGPQRPDPPAIQVARVKLEEYRQAIGKLENLRDA